MLDYCERLSMEEKSFCDWVLWCLSELKMVATDCLTSLLRSYLMMAFFFLVCRVLGTKSSASYSRIIYPNRSGAFIVFSSIKSSGPSDSDSLCDCSSIEKLSSSASLTSAMRSLPLLVGEREPPCF